jgi:aminopeptidase N
MRSFFILFVFVFVFAAKGIFAQQSKIPTFFENEKSAYKHKVAFKTTTEHQDYDLVYHSIYWTVDPAIQFIGGKVTSYLKVLESGFNAIHFDLYNGLNVDSVWYKNQNTSFIHDNDIITIALPETVPINTLDSITVFYHGVPPTGTGFGAFETNEHNGIPIMWTLSEPYGAKEWWPCKQTLYDKIDSIDIFIETPMAYKAASNGKLMAETIVGSSKITHWKHRFPIATYLVAIAVTNYEAFSDYAAVDSVNTVEILNYVYPEQKDEIVPQAAYTVNVLELYSQLFIPYPFYTEKYGHAQFGWGGGMEHQTMSFMGSFSQALIAHELSHQWFGDYVTCASWQDIWVNEGFAVFCESVVQEYLHPENYLTWKKERMQLVLDYASSGSVFVEDTSNVNRIFNYYLTYQKGGLIIHQLRNQIGDDAFFTGIRNMLTHNDTKGRFATSGMVKAFFEEAADTSLSTYFDDWYFGEGYPQYTINWLQGSNNDISFNISQSTTHESIPFYAMHVPVLLVGDNNEKLVRFHNTENNQLFTYNPGFAVSNVVFDPEYTIIAPHPANIVLNIEENIFNNQLVVAPNPTNDKLLVKTTNDTKIVSIRILNNSGHLVYFEEFPSLLRKKQIDISQLANGIYYVQVKTDHNMITKKIVKNP